MAEEPTVQPTPEQTPPQPAVGPAGPPGPEGQTYQGTTPQPGVGGFVEPGQPTEGAGLPKPEERDEQARQGQEAQGGAEAQAAPEMNQSHDVVVGDKVQLNGSLFQVASGQYNWTCKGPDGETVPLTNASMPGPSFTATQTGAYVAKLTTNDGEATITVNAAESDMPLRSGGGTSPTRVPLHSGGTLVGPSPEMERLRQEEALRVSGQLSPEEQRQADQLRQQQELRQQEELRPGETEEQRQDRLRREREAAAQSV